MGKVWGPAGVRSREAVLAWREGSRFSSMRDGEAAFLRRGAPGQGLGPRRSWLGILLGAVGFLMYALKSSLGLGVLLHIVFFVAMGAGDHIELESDVGEGWRKGGKEIR